VVSCPTGTSGPPASPVPRQQPLPVALDSFLAAWTGLLVVVAPLHRLLPAVVASSAAGADLAPCPRTRPAPFPRSGPAFPPTASSGASTAFSTRTLLGTHSLRCSRLRTSTTSAWFARWDRIGTGRCSGCEAPAPLCVGRRTMPSPPALKRQAAGHRCCRTRYPTASPAAAAGGWAWSWSSSFSPNGDGHNCWKGRIVVVSWVFFFSPRDSRRAKAQCVVGLLGAAGLLGCAVRGGSGGRWQLCQVGFCSPASGACALRLYSA
jgi:hypothetical protein